MFFVGLWDVFNLVTAGVALGAVAERRRRDTHPRLRIARRGMLARGDQRMRVAIEDVSIEGCSLRIDSADDAASLDMTEPAELRLIVRPCGGVAPPSLPIRTIERAPGESLAVSFGALSPQEHLALADLMYGDADALAKFVAARRRHKSILAGTIQFLWWSVIEPIRAFSYLRPRASDASLREPPAFTDLPTLRLPRLPARRPTRAAAAPRRSETV
jgi:cellulose synthase (UDP-forming)